MRNGEPHQFSMVREQSRFTVHRSGAVSVAVKMATGKEGWEVMERQKREEATNPGEVNHKKEEFEGAEGGLKLGLWFRSWKCVG